MVKNRIFMAPSSRRKIFSLCLVASGALLSSCGQSLSREEAQELLGKIVANTASSTFSTPKSWTVDSTLKGEGTIEGQSLNGTISISEQFSSDDCYYHTSASVEGNLASSVSGKYTIEEWIYLDSTKLSGAPVTALVQALSNDFTKSKVYTMNYYHSYDSAVQDFNANAEIKEQKSRVEDLAKVPNAFKEQLAALTKDNIVSETYTTSNTYSFSAAVSFKENNETSEEKITIKEGYLQNVTTSTPSANAVLSYSWNLFKASHPDLGNYSTPSESSTVTLL
jgi:hypothetical protein